MHTHLPSRGLHRRAGSGKATVATLLAAALGVGASLYPADVPGLIGIPSSQQEAEDFTALAPSVYARPRRADITLLMTSGLANVVSSSATFELQTELLELAKSYGSPELVRSLELMRSIQESARSPQLVFGGGGGGGQAAVSSTDAFLELVVLLENILRTLPGVSGPALAELVTNLLPSVLRSLETVVGSPAAASAAVGVMEVAPPPSESPSAPIQAVPNKPAPEPTVSPSTEPPKPQPEPTSAAPSTQQPAPESAAPTVDSIVTDKPPAPRTTPEPSPTVAPEPDDDSEPTATSEPEPQEDNTDGDSGSEESDSNPSGEQQSSNDVGSANDSPDTGSNDGGGASQGNDSTNE